MADEDLEGVHFRAFYGRPGELMVAVRLFCWFVGAVVVQGTSIQLQCEYSTTLIAPMLLGHEWLVEQRKNYS